jgi:hypothetical protein
LIRNLEIAGVQIRHRLPFRVQRESV